MGDRPEKDTFTVCSVLPLCLEIFQLYMYMGGNIIGHGITQIAQHSDL